MALSIAAWLVGVGAGLVMIPTSIALLIGLAMVPFPAADRWFGLAMIATFPLLPPVALPNLPVGAAVLVLAFVRIGRSDRRRPSRRTIITLAVLWGTLAIGVALSHWPAVNVWIRPVFILALGALTSALGAFVWWDPDRRGRWLDGIALGVILVAGSALLVFTLQYVASISSIVDGVAGVLAHVRGETAGAKFDAANNWLIVGDGVTLRAVSPLFPSPNNLGGYLGLLLPLVTVRWLTAKERPWRTVAGTAVALGVATMLMTFSRSTWLALSLAAILGGVIITAFKLWRIQEWPSRRRLGQAIAVLLFAAAIGSIGVLTTGHQAAEDRITRPLEDLSVTTRLEINGEALAAVGNDPLRGAGIGNWEAALAERNGRSYVHNVYLEYATATGLFGLAWSLLIILVPLACGLAATVAVGAAEGRLLGVGLIVGVAFAAVQFLFDDNLLNPQYAWLHAWIVGGGLGLIDVRRLR